MPLTIDPGFSNHHVTVGAKPDSRISRKVGHLRMAESVTTHHELRVGGDAVPC